MTTLPHRNICVKNRHCAVQYPPRKSGAKSGIFDVLCSGWLSGDSMLSCNEFGPTDRMTITGNNVEKDRVRDIMNGTVKKMFKNTLS